MTVPGQPDNVIDLDSRRPSTAVAEQTVFDALDEIRADYVQSGDEMGVALCDLLARALR